MKHGTRTLADVVIEMLERMARDMLARKPGGHLVGSKRRELELRLPLVLGDGEAHRETLAQSLLVSMDRLLDDTIQQQAVFRPGHAFCHRCRSAACEHSLPPSSRHVGLGYAPTGAPRWIDFAQLCLELKHPAVQRLYDQPPAFLTLIHDKAELHRGLLQAFGDASYELLGQVSAGFFPVRVRAGEGRGVLALTIQAAASRTAAGARVGLNLLGRAPDGNGLDRLWERHDDLPWRKPIRWAQSALATLPPRRLRRAQHPATVAAVDQRVGGILQGLARRLEREQRARSRRTRHAEERHRSGERPTRKAIDDARRAGAESVLVDDKSGTFVVIGDRGRTHFFTPRGRLVSSVRYSREAVERKVRLERWRAAGDEERGAFRRHLPD